MPLRRLPRRPAAAADFRDRGLLNALRSELYDELTSSQIHEEATLPSNFSIQYNSPNSQDIFLKNQQNNPKEEIYVSALLAPLRFTNEESFIRKVFMKVCVKKPNLESVLRFDCSVFKRGESSDFRVKGAWYHFDLDNLGFEKKYLGPEFRTLDPKLQAAYKDYLISRDIDTELTNFLLKHLTNKEQGQYVNWLRTLEIACICK